MWSVLGDRPSFSSPLIQSTALSDTDLDVDVDYSDDDDDDNDDNDDVIYLSHSNMVDT